MTYAFKHILAGLALVASSAAFTAEANPTRAGVPKALGQLQQVHIAVHEGGIVDCFSSRDRTERSEPLDAELLHHQFLDDASHLVVAQRAADRFRHVGGPTQHLAQFAVIRAPVPVSHRRPI